MTDELESLRNWFRQWGACVAAVDFAAARPLFSEDVIGFGTHAMFVSGLDALQAEQWQQVWPNISGFEFLVDELTGDISGDAAWAAVPWGSVGYHEDGSSFDRPGRATVTFRRAPQSSPADWLGTHTHFSLRPGTPPRTFGRR